MRLAWTISCFFVLLAFSCSDPAPEGTPIGKDASAEASCAGTGTGGTSGSGGSSGLSGSGGRSGSGGSAGNHEAGDSPLPDADVPVDASVDADPHDSSETGRDSTGGSGGKEDSGPEADVSEATDCANDADPRPDTDVDGAADARVDPDAGVGCGWRTDTVAPKAGPSVPRIATGPRDELHAVFTVVQEPEDLDPARRSVAHSVNTGTGWVQERVAQGELPDVAIDSNGAAHLCFTSQAGLVYATDASGGWTQEVIYRHGEQYVDPSSTEHVTSLTSPCSIALDPSGRAYVAFAFTYSLPTIPLSGGDLVVYLDKRNSAWTRTTVTGESGEGYFEAVEIVTPAEHDVRVVARYRPGYFIRHFSASGLSSIAPHFPETLDFYDCDLAVDPGGRSQVFIDYLRPDRFEDFLNSAHAVLENGAWTYEPFVKQLISPSLFIDSGGNLHLSYRNDALLYSRKRAGAWQEQIIDESVTGSESSIAVTQSGVPHVFYTDEDGSLTHAAGCAL
jgi:hypothetical protein